MPISFVAAGTTFSATGGSTSITLNCPAGVAAGDNLVALVAFWANGSQRTVTCSGWTVRQTAYRSYNGDQVQLCLLTRDATASEPADWTATVSGTVYLRVAAVSAYRGVQAFGLSGQTSVAAGSSLTTSTLNNTVANSWRVTLGAYMSATATYTIASNETTRRFLMTADNSGAIQAALWDSNAVIATGNTSRTVSRSAAWNIGLSAILLLEPQTGTPATGTFEDTLGKVAAAADGEVHNDAALDSSLGSVTSLADGYGQPPVGTGSFDAQLGPVAASATGGTVVQGSMTALLPLGVNIVGETRKYGVRVISVDSEDRRIRIPSRGVEI